ncbi:MAG: hypothetical protein DRH15_06515, partial [Deltaproteobacteria bacterium]
MKISHPDVLPLELRSRLQALMFIRVIFVSILLGAGLFIHVNETRIYFGHVQSVHFLLLASVYLLTIVYIVFLKSTRAYTLLSYIQLGADALFTALLMTVTGGMHSVFSLLFVLVLITASILLYRIGGVLMAATCSFLYSMVVALHYLDVLKTPTGSLFPAPPTPGPTVLYLAFVNILAFFVIAFLTSYLSELVQRSKTELEARQEDLQQLESLTAGIINSVSSGVIALDNKGNVVLFNPACEVIFGLSSQEVLGKRLEEVLPSLSESLNSAGKTIVDHVPHPPRFNDLTLHHDGKKVFLRYSLSPLRLSPRGAFGQIIVVQDISEIRQIEDEMARVRGLAIVGELAAGIAHEIRNPMASISGSIQMLKEEMGENQMQTRLMDIALNEVNRLNQLVNDFLIFARPRQPHPEVFELRELVEQTLELFKHSPHWMKKIDVSASLNGPLPVKSDPQLVKQILWNLLRNACEAMPSGGKLQVLARPCVESNPLPAVELEIRDTGPGLDEKDLSK